VKKGCNTCTEHLIFLPSFFLSDHLPLSSSKEIDGVVLDLHQGKVGGAAEHPPVAQDVPDEQATRGDELEEVEEQGTGGEQGAGGDKHLLDGELLGAALVEIIHALQNLHKSH